MNKDDRLLLDLLLDQPDFALAAIAQIGAGALLTGAALAAQVGEAVQTIV